MPKFDGTGPQGRGSLTGRGFGPCEDIENDSQNENKILKKLEEIEERLKKIEEKNG